MTFCQREGRAAIHITVAKDKRRLQVEKYPTSRVNLVLTACAEDDVRLEELALVVPLDAHEVGAVVHAPALVARYRR